MIVYVGFVWCWVFVVCLFFKLSSLLYFLLLPVVLDIWSLRLLWRLSKTGIECVWVFCIFFALLEKSWTGISLGLVFLILIAFCVFVLIHFALQPLILALCAAVFLWCLQHCTSFNESVSSTYRSLIAVQLLSLLIFLRIMGSVSHDLIQNTFTHLYSQMLY